MAHHPKCYVQVDAATAWATSYGTVGSEGCRICEWIVEIEQDTIVDITAEWMSNHGDRWEFKAGQRDMLAKCIEVVDGLPLDPETDAGLVAASTILHKLKLGK